ncbi:MAG: SRPBCC family protein [Candidatus Limnocylindrales bacterium]
MADFERSTTVGVGADTAFAFFADPGRLPEYVTTMRLEETTAVDGDPDAQPEADAKGLRPVSEARFLANRAARRVEWSLPGSDYAGSITVTAGTKSTSGVTIRLHIRDDAGTAEMDTVLDQTVRNIQRLLSGR